MRIEERPAYIFSQSICALAEIEAMKALNTYRESRGETIAYDEEAFLDVPDKYGISHNAVLDLLNQP